MEDLIPRTFQGRADWDDHMSGNLISAGFHYFSDASDEAAVLYLHSIFGVICWSYHKVHQFGERGISEISH